MIEELKIIAEIFSKATDGALYAYIAYVVYQLVKISLIIFPIVNLMKYITNKVFISEDS